MLCDVETTLGEFIDRQGVSFIASVSKDGFPHMKAMLPPRKQVGIQMCIRDSFGPETPLRPVGEGFAVRVKVRVSPQFWSWLFGLGAGARILEPPEAVNAYLRYARETLAPYGEGEGEQ